jgi:SAM-dependent methyltransferase
VIACPTCRGGLRPEPDRLHCSRCDAAYPFASGAVVFHADPAAVRVMPQGHISNAIPASHLEWLRRVEGTTLNLGAGGTAERLPRCVELEYSIFRHTDVAADAHRLPFRDEVFDAVVTFNTFEHLHTPTAAAEEIRRVLKPGGSLVLHTAFLQPLHEAPHHYYNATEFGVRHWFKGFEIDSVGVSPNFNPAYTLAWLTWVLLNGVGATVGAAERERLERTTLREWREMWESPSKTGPLVDLVARLPQEQQAQIAAGFELRARKPV